MVVLHLHKIVKEADGAEYQGEGQHQQRAVGAGGNVLPAHGEYRHGDAHDKHQAAHGGGILLGVVPRRAVLLHALSGLQPAQQGDEHLTRQKGHHKGHQEAYYISHLLNLPNLRPHAPGFSGPFSQSGILP